MCHFTASLNSTLEGAKVARELQRQCRSAWEQGEQSRTGSTRSAVFFDTFAHFLSIAAS